MSPKYFSDKAIWFDRSTKIDALHGKELLVLQRDSDTVESTNLRVDSSEPERRQVCVVAWNVIPVDKAWQEIQVPPKAAEYETGPYERFLTQDALDSIRPHNARLLGDVELELVMQD